MKFEIDREEFEEALRKAREATEKKTALPILTNFLIAADSNGVTVKATDLENYLVMALRAEVREPGTVCVNSRGISDIVRNMSSAMVDVGFSDGKLVLQGGRSVFKLPTVDPEDFPEFPDVQSEGYSIEGSKLLTGIDKTEYSISREESRVALQGMFMKGVDGKTHFVGSDGHRLAIFETEGKFPYELLIPRKSLKVLQKLITGIEEVYVYRSADNNFASIMGEGWRLVVRLLEEEYPDYQAVIPTEFSAEAIFDRGEVVRVLKRLSGLSEGGLFPVKITLLDNLAIFEFVDPEKGEGREEMDIDYLGEPFEIGFNGKYLLEALENMDSKRVWFKFTTPDTASLLEPENYEEEPYRCIIMPMRV